MPSMLAGTRAFISGEMSGNRTPQALGLAQVFVQEWQNRLQFDKERLRAHSSSISSSLYEEILITDHNRSAGPEFGVRLSSASSNEGRNDRHAKGLYRLLQ